MLNAASTTIVESWNGANLAELGPIYPFVGSEFILWIVGLAFWIGFHILGGRVEKHEMAADEAAARDPERLKRVFTEERDE